MKACVIVDRNNKIIAACNPDEMQSADGMVISLVPLKAQKKYEITVPLALHQEDHTKMLNDILGRKINAKSKAFILSKKEAAHGRV